MKRALLALLLSTLSLAGGAETIAVVGGTVYTAGPDGTLQNATIVIRDSQIVSVMAEGPVPDGAVVLDANGKIVTPGLFTPAGRIGLEEVGNSAGPVDSIQRGDNFTAGFEVADAFNPRSTLVAINRIEGVTRAAILPSASSPDGSGMHSRVISGMAAIANLGGSDTSIDRRHAALVATLGERGAGLAGESRASALLELRLALDEAIEYREHADAWQRGEYRDFAHSRADLEALQAVLAGDLALLVHVNRASDISALLKLAAEYEALKLIVSGGVEAWMVAEELAAAKVPVIVAPEENLPADFDRINARDDNATILVNAGVAIAFADGQATTHNARNITQTAGNAVAEGLSYEQALEAVTIAPARMYGVADRLGSIEPGKQADLVIWPGDPFELANYPEAVIIGGEAVEMQSRQTLLRDRYRDVNSTLPPAYRR